MLVCGLMLVCRMGMLITAAETLCLCRGEEDESLAIKPPQQMTRKDKSYHRKEEKRKDKRRHRSHSAEGGQHLIQTKMSPITQHYNKDMNASINESRVFSADPVPLKMF